jgi:hypothetical protein
MWFSKTTRDRIRTNGAECKRTIRLTKINIVGHSKGGLDARIFLDITDTKDIANLIMIGTPNAGSIVAETNNACSPAVSDSRPRANATKAIINPNTKYYTIAGDWMPLIHGNPMIPGNDDGLTPVDSVESQDSSGI